MELDRSTLVRIPALSDNADAKPPAPGPTQHQLSIFGVFGSRSRSRKLPQKTSVFREMLVSRLGLEPRTL